MKRISVSIPVVLLCIAVAVPGADARFKRVKSVMSGAMDICQAVDDGQTTVLDGGIELCCAQEVTQYDNSGHIDFGKEYCVACTQGTDDCVLWENTRNAPSAQDVKKALSTMPKQTPAKAN